MDEANRPPRRRLSRLKRLVATQSLTDDFDADDLRGKVRRGVGWKLLNVTLGQGSEIVISIVLAHLLLPHDFGLAGLAIAFSGIPLQFTDLGLGAALVRTKTITEEDRSTVFWACVVAGTVLMLVGVGASPLIAGFFSNPRVMPMFAVLSTSFLFLSLGQTQSALLTREMSFRSLELRNIAATLVGALAALVVALAGGGAWAIIAQVVCTSAGSTVMLWTVSPWRPQRTFSRESFRTLGAFGVKSLGMRMLGWANLNTDNLLVGRVLGSTALGIYSIAYNVMVLPSSNIMAPLRDVLFAAFARLRDEPRRLGEAWLRINSVAGSVLVPAFVGLAVVAPDFVPAVLGQRWHAAIPVLQLLSLGGAAQSLQSFNGQVYQALGRPGLFLRFLCFATALMVTGFGIGLLWGVAGVAGSYAVARTILLVANSVQMSRLMHFSVWRMMRSYVDIFGRAAAMAAAVYGERLALIHLGVPLGVRLAALVVGGTLSYLLVTMVVAPNLLRDVRDGLLRRRVVTA
jgi:O-antigen/teichoic acid export membrane protein